MNLFAKLWRDEAGVLLSAEAVVVGTVAVVGLTTGLTVVAKAVNEELQDVAFAIRSLDQSYSIPAIEGCGARTAGSSFTQEPVKKSLDELTTVIEKAEKEEKTQAERLQQQMKKKDKDNNKDGEDTKKKKKREQNI
jgi:hypothetical protein